jgi:hypothetical protein
MCIQPADAVNVIGGREYFGWESAAASRKGGHRQLTLR